MKIPTLIYTVQQYMWPLWHDVPSTSDRAKAYALKDKVGHNARVLKLSRSRPAKVRVRIGS